MEGTSKQNKTGQNKRKKKTDILKAEATITVSIMKLVNHLRHIRKRLSGALFFKGGQGKRMKGCQTL